MYIFIEGKVQQVLIYAEKSNQYCLLTAEVQRSMSVNDKNHQPWVIVSENGSVDAAHCTCMAGYVSNFLIFKSY